VCMCVCVCVCGNCYYLKRVQFSRAGNWWWLPTCNLYWSGGEDHL